MTLPLESSGIYNFTVNWGDGNSNVIITWNQPEVTHTYSSPRVYTVSITGAIEGFRFNNGGDKTKILNIAQWGILKVLNYERYFMVVVTLTALQAILHSASSVKQDIGNWYTSNVTTMAYVLTDAQNFNQDMGSWSTSKVKNMSGFLKGLRYFNHDLGVWDTSNVIKMSGMLNSIDSFDQDISSSNTSAVTNFDHMRKSTGAFTQDLSSWCVTSVNGASGAGTEHDDFDSGSTSWSNDPAWGTSMGNVSRYTDTNTLVVLRYSDCVIVLLKCGIRRLTIQNFNLTEAYQSRVYTNPSLYSRISGIK